MRGTRDDRALTIRSSRRRRTPVVSPARPPPEEDGPNTSCSRDRSPRHGPDIEALRRSRVRELGCAGPAQPVVEEVGNEEQAICCASPASWSADMAARAKTVLSAKLDPGRSRAHESDAAKHAGRPCGSARVAVVEQGSERPSGDVEQAEVRFHRVNPYGVDLGRFGPPCGGHRAHRRRDAGCPSAASPDPHRHVLESVDLLHREPFAVEATRARTRRLGPLGRRRRRSALSQSGHLPSAPRAAVAVAPFRAEYDRCDAASSQGPGERAHEVALDSEDVVRRKHRQELVVPQSRRACTCARSGSSARSAGPARQAKLDTTTAIADHHVKLVVPRGRGARR